VGYNNQPNVIVQIDNKAIREQQEKADRQTQVLNQGASLITADQTTPLDIQVEGRTLVPLQNTNLVGDGTHVLANADKKTKIIVDNKTVAGVAKFTKNSTLTRKATYAGKVPGSTVDNPHIAKINTGSTLQAPANFGASEFSAGYASISALGGALATVSAPTNGNVAQELFSIDLIQEVERNMGRIPGADTAAKVAWLKENLQSFDINWHGHGSGPTGNKVSLSVWIVNTSSWVLFTSHTSGAPSLIQGYSNSAGAIAARIDANGFVHYLAYADASDGVTPSVVNTDFLEVIIAVKATAQLDTRPVIIRTTSFEGKIQGSTVENPHSAFTILGSSLQAPSATTGKFDWNASQISYDQIGSLNGVSKGISSSTSGYIAQNLFAFDLIAEIERNLGRIPKTTIADKAQWVKENLSRVTLNWYGYGSGPAGNKGQTYMRNNVANSGAGSWVGGGLNLQSTPTKTVTTLNSTGWFGPSGAIVDQTGNAYALVAAEATDGVTPSTIATDFVELEIELIPGAVLHDPQVPLYQVESADYAKILGEWPEAQVLTRYPKTTGIQHVQNPYVMAEGENLLPPFYEWDDLTSGKGTILEPYKVRIAGGVAGNRYAVYIPAIEGQSYSFNANKDEGPGLVYFYFCDAAKNRLQGSTSQTSGTAPAGTKLMEVVLNPGVTNADYGFSNPILTLGSVEKPFTPRNPSYLFTQVKLGQIGSTKDVLYKADGWKVRKNIEKDVIMDGTLAWSYFANRTTFKTFKLPKFNPDMIKYPSVLVGHEGQRIPANDSSNVDLEVYRQQSVDSYFYLNADNAKTGMGAAYIPVDDEVKAYFNGWQAKTVDGTGKPTSWRSLGDGVDAPTQTLAYVKANKAPNFTPYKISYVLDVPVTEDVSDKVEGDITVNGITQVEVGSGVIVREKVTPRVDGTQRVLVDGLSKWDGSYWAGSRVVYPVSKWLKMYKNGVPDENWKVGAVNNTLYIPAEKYDSTAEYKVTYTVMNKEKLTVNPYNLKATYAKNIRSALEDVVKKQEDNTRDISVNVQAVAELYKRMKSMGG